MPVPDPGVSGELLRATLSMGVVCPDSFHPRAVVAVLDPNNSPVMLAEGEQERDLEAVGGVIPIKTEIAIRPMQPGSYHFVARFEPNLGTRQEDVLVAENWKAATPDIVVERPARELLECKQVDVSDGGQVLCLSPRGRMFARTGGLIGTLPGEAVRDGTVLWAYDSMGVSRWVEREDGGFSEAGSHNLFGGTALIAPAQGGVVIATASGILTRFVPTDAGLDQRPISFASPSSPLALWASREHYLVWGSERSCRGPRNGQESCEFGLSLLSGLAARPVGAEPGGMWFLEDTGSNALLRIDETDAQLRLDLPADWQSEPPPAGVRWDTSPTFVSRDGGRFIGGARGDELVLQKFADAPFISASREWAAFRWGDGGVALFRR